MHVIEKLRDINSLSRSEQVEILHGVWNFSLALCVFACIATLVVMLVRLIEFLA